MKKYIIAIVLLTAAKLADAHEWDADRWADAQLALADDVRTCVDIIEKDPGTDVCDGLTKRSIANAVELAIAIETHDAFNSDVGEKEFISEFNNVKRGGQALMATRFIKSGLEYIIAMKKQHDERLKREKEKIKKDLGIMI